MVKEGRFRPIKTRPLINGLQVVEKLINCNWFRARLRNGLKFDIKDYPRFKTSSLWFRIGFVDMWGLRLSLGRLSQELRIDVSGEAVGSRLGEAVGFSSSSGLEYISRSRF